MNEEGNTAGPGNPGRRDFLKTAGAAAIAVGAAAQMRPVFSASGSDMLRVGLIGCGGRGQYDTSNFLRAAEGVELVAMADLFLDKLDGAAASLKERFPENFNVKPEHRFTGFDAFQKLLALDEVDVVILTEPPHFRPEHLEAAINAGKHAFIEKPVAVDPVGVRRVIAAADLADQKGLTIVAGTQARRMPARIELVQRLRDGAIGDLVSGQVVRLGGAMRGWKSHLMEQPEGMSDMEYQIRRWLFYTWLSGDFLAEMHVHELDIMNWLMGATPVQVTALGGRQSRTEKAFGDVWDNFSAELLYPNDVRVLYMGCQIDGVSGRTDERVEGTKGLAYTSWSTSRLSGDTTWEYNGPAVDPCIQQHKEQIEAIRAGEKLNEGRRIAESSLTAIMCRVSAYTARTFQWDWILETSELDLRPEKYEFGPLPPVEVAQPGVTKLI